MPVMAAVAIAKDLVRGSMHQVGPIKPCDLSSLSCHVRLPIYLVRGLESCGTLRLKIWRRSGVALEFSIPSRNLSEVYRLNP
jgi:hypothetical protein